MPLQNRVTATGDIVADPARGLFMGNRGRLHDADRRLGRARWRGKAWIICLLSFRGRRRSLMAPGSYTELFFLDEAVALAAGHRPCAECRRDAYRAYRAAAGIAGTAAEMDHALHEARLTGRPARRRLFEADIRDLPDGTVIVREAPMLLIGGRMRPVALSGYGPAAPRPRSGPVQVLTPAPSVAALRGGYAPVLHPSAF